LGGSSLSDRAKIIIYALANNTRAIEDLDDMFNQSKTEQSADLKHLPSSLYHWQ